MKISNFRAFVVDENQNGIVGNVRKCTVADLSEGDTLIKNSFSGFNYKDALAINQKGGVIRSYPMIPGIDAIGEVLESLNPKLIKGEKVIITGNGLGVSHTGGFSELIRIPGDWVVKLPATLTKKEAAIIGTAGITAVEAINKLEEIGMTKNNHVLITGATGGVGSLTIAMLKSLGYDNITALTRKKNENYLRRLGATKIRSLEEFLPEKIKPLQKQAYDFAIDTIGGETVAAILPQISYGGGVALCGNASGITFTSTVLPFILRGISLVGVDSVQLSNDRKETIWRQIGEKLDKSLLEKIGEQEVTLDDVNNVATTLIKGKHSGRTIIRL